MKVLRFKNENEEKIELNFCDSGLYIEISDSSEMYNFIIEEEYIEELIDFLKNNYIHNGE